MHWDPFHPRLSRHAAPSEGLPKSSAKKLWQRLLLEGDTVIVVGHRDPLWSPSNAPTRYQERLLLGGSGEWHTPTTVG